MAEAIRKGTSPTISTVYSTPAFIPSEELQLLPEGTLDHRSDEEIAQLLQTPRPVTSEKNVWTYWHTGFPTVRPYVRRFIIGWVRRLGPEWTVRVLDRVEDSPMNVSNYLDDSEFHEAYKNGTMTGKYVGTHSADLVRLPLLYRYGGVWMDAGTMLFRHLDEICWNVIEDPNNHYEICACGVGDVPTYDVIMTGLIATKRGNPFIKRWHKLYLEIWKNGVTESTDLRDHPLLRPVPKFKISENARKLLNLNEALFNDYLTHFLAFRRVRMLQDPSDGFDGLKYWETHAYVVDVMETFALQRLTNWNGDKQWELMSLQREGADSSTELYKEADELTHYLLARASTMKLSHGLGNSLMKHLSMFWERPENSDADIKPGTFAAYLSWGSVHCEQTRQINPGKVVCKGDVVKAGLLEVINQYPSHD